MRRPFALTLAALAGLGLLSGTGRAQLPSTAPQPLQSFQGSASQTTAAFQAPDSWEVRWSGGRTVNVTVLAADNSIVAGSAGPRGALYLPKGGTYHLQIDYAPLPVMPGQQAPAENPPQSQFERTIAGGDSGSSTDNNGNGGTDGNAPGTPAYAQQMQAQMQARMMAMMNRPYAVEVVPMSTATSTPSTGFDAPPNFTVPAGVSLASTPGAALTPAIPPVPAAAASSNPAPAASGSLSTDQARAVVLIKGDKAEGTGFIIKTPNGPAVITNIHVIADNPNVKITTNTGEVVTVTSQKCAADRDLAMLTIQDNGYSCLEMAPDISKVVQPGDEVITPGNSEGGEVMLNTSGKVLGVGPERIEIDNPIYHGNSGGPVFHPKSGKVLGVVTCAIPVDMSDDLDKTSFANRNSAIASKMRYFALRLDTVSQWIDVDPRAFEIETTFLDRFQQQSERLDAYLNRSDSNTDNSNGDSGSSGSGSGQDDSKIYLDDEKIMKADNNYASNASNGDTEQHIEALRNLLFDLQGVADTDMDKVQNMNNFYPFDQDRARDEMDYRKALKSELDSIGNNIERLGSLPRANN